MVKRVYLDQWVWIRLTDVALGEPEAPAWDDVLDLAIAAADSGLASFPLGTAHYMELAKAPAWRRAQVGTVMATLSRDHRMIGPVPAVIQDEIARALDRLIGPGPVDRKPLRVFGLGYAHAFGIAATDPSFDVIRAIGPQREVALLANIALQDSEEKTLRENLEGGATSFAVGEASTAETIAAEGLINRIGDVLHAQEIVAMLDYLVPALEERGSSFDAIAGAENPKAL